MLAGMPQAPSALLAGADNPGGTKARRNEVLRQDGRARDDHARPTAQTEMKKGLGLHMDDYFSRARERYVLDYVKSELIKEYGAQTRPARRLQGLHDDQPQEAEGGARGDRRHARRRRPVVGDRHDRPEQRRHPRDGLVGRLRPTVEVQPRRPGPPPARLVVQGHGADDRAARGREPELDDATCRVSPMELDDPPCGAPIDVESRPTAARARGSMNLRQATLRLRQLRLRAARAPTSGRTRSRRRRG